MAELNPVCSDGPRTAVDEDGLASAQVCLFQRRQGIEPAVADCCSLLEAHAGRLIRDSGALPHADELGVRTEAEPSYAEDVVAGDELADRAADGDHLPGKLGPQDALSRPAHAKNEA